MPESREKPGSDESSASVAAARAGAPSWAEFRRQMPVVDEWAYFNHAAVAPISEPARAVTEAWAADMATAGGMCGASWVPQIEKARRLGAALMGAAADDVALIRNTTEGIGLVAEGFPWGAGDNVVTLAGEFPSNLYPWINLERRGVEVRLVEVPNEQVEIDSILEACDARTRIVSVSWVGYASGWRIDVDRLVEAVHQRGALVMLDAIQGLGVFPLNVSCTPVDFLAADSHKWLLGPEGAGLFYLRREHLDLLAPLGVGWNSVVHAGDYANRAMVLKQKASRYEGGSANTVGFAAMGASLELLLQYGTDRIAPRVLEITELCCERLRALGATIASHRDLAHASGIVSFELPGRDPQQARRRAAAAKVAIACRNGRLRVSPHAYNDESDVDRLIDALRPTSA